ncbi:MAG: ribonuclease HII [Pleurocapsa minor GSE-CHR-MK-17-07R]|jgi:ribonuclease HII|nr:ribonuclease HII [Pleurocapsa minor GSE-CHR-MK 17-07R]
MPAPAPKTAPLDLERALWSAGHSAVYGIDEAGRGAWAGPVVAACVCLPPGEPDALYAALVGVNDSKQVDSITRTRLALVVREHALCWGVGAASSAEIDQFGIVPANQQAMHRAYLAARARHPAGACQHLLLDHVRWAWDNTPFTSMTKGDARSLSIAAASILAKVHRDDLMIAFESQYPGYGFASHKGYGTAAHQDAITRLGPCPIHRMTFAPLRPHLL